MWILDHKGDAICLKNVEVIGAVKTDDGRWSARAWYNREHETYRDLQFFDDEQATRDYVRSLAARMNADLV